MNGKTDSHHQAINIVIVDDEIGLINAISKIPRLENYDVFSSFDDSYDILKMVVRNPEEIYEMIDLLTLRDS